jgi:hypothetical protein
MDELEISLIFCLQLKFNVRKYNLFQTHKSFKVQKLRSFNLSVDTGKIKEQALGHSYATTRMALCTYVTEFPLL